MSVDREQIKAKFPLVTELERRGVVVIGSGNQLKAKCPFHQDNNASLSINAPKQIWKCFAGCGEGSVIDLIAKYDSKTPEAVFKELAKELEGAEPIKPATTEKPVIDKIYSYTNELGQEAFQIVRLKPKSFRQRHIGADGKWVWNMQGVTRHLYRLPEVLKAETVWFVEGEKDADNLAKLGFTATCISGGAKGWLDSYVEHLCGKDIVLCGDNDEPGKAFIKQVFEACSGKVKMARIVTIPAPAKDVSDYIEANQSTAKADLGSMYIRAQIFTKGIDIPLFTMAELEPRYRSFAEGLEKQCVDLGKWLPNLNRYIRRQVPGELVTIIADTGVGKTGILQNIALSQLPLPTVMFQMELPAEMLFERFIAIKTKNSQGAIESAYAGGYDTPHIGEIDKWFANLLICEKPKLTAEKIEEYVNKAELKLGQRPKLVIVDYIGLMAGPGKTKTERIAEIAENLKCVAKATGTVVIMACQVTRDKNAATPELSLHDAKDSGSIENSSGVLLGAWRDAKDRTKLIVRVLKCTKGMVGKITDIECYFDGPTMNITQMSPISDHDIPN